MNIRIIGAVLIAAILGWLAGPPVGERAMDRILARAAVTDGWAVNYHLGTYEGRWLLRSIIARVGLGALVPEEALYYRTSVDSNGDPLTGEQVYRIGLDSESVPPANAFWSITPYDVETLQLVDSPIARYQIGSRTRDVRCHFPTNSAGIHLSVSPGGNWLPIPAGSFDLVLRAYEPSQEMLAGDWQPPEVVRLERVPFHVTGTSSNIGNCPGFRHLWQPFVYEPSESFFEDFEDSDEGDEEEEAGQ